MEEKEILEAEEKLRVAMVNSNFNDLQELLSDDLLFTSYFGALISKEDDIAIHQSGNLKFKSLELSNFTVQLHPGFAVVSVQANIKATFNGQPSDGVFMFTRVWAKQPGGLKVVAGHASQKA